MTGVLWTALVAFAPVIAPMDQALAQAQRSTRRELVGVVRDSSGGPVEDATVAISDMTARTDARGAFRLWTSDIDTVTISIRRLGYSAMSALLTARDRQWDTVVVELDRTSQALAAVTVKESPTRRALGLRNFEERRARGLGVFVTRAQIAARNTMRPSDVVRTLRGVRVVRLRNGSYGVRFALYDRRPSCAPDIWLDGQRARGLEIDELTANDIEAMELYESWSTLPFEFSQGSTVPCGTIVVWTRVPGQE
jgi:hypothetical protein